MNTHDDFKLLISAYYDGEVSTEEKQTVEAHLRDCAACRKYLLELQMISSSLRKWSNETPSPDLEQKIHNRVSNKGEPMYPSTLRVTQMAGGVVVLVLLAAVSLQTMNQRTIQSRVTDTSRYLTAQTQLAVQTPKAEPQKVDQLAFFQDKAAAIYGTKSRLKSAADDIGDQYSAGNTKVTASRSQIALQKTSQYEPYYLETDYKEPAEGQIVLSEKKFEARDEVGQKMKSLERVRTSGGFQSSDYGSYDKNQRSDLAVPATAPAIYEPQPYQTKGEEVHRYIGKDVYDIRDREFNTEGYDRIYENAFLEAKENPLSTFSIDVDTASYSNIRRFLNNGQLPPPDAVRIEEMINYFTYDYPQPRGKDPFSITAETAPCPWNPNHNLVMVGLQGKDLDEKTAVPSNLVFLIDVSGSMNDPQKLPLLKSAFRMMVKQLRDNERIAIVTYAGSAGLVLDSTPGYDKQAILDALDRLQAGGSTAGGEGIQLAYQVAQRNFIRNGNNRIILATDGDFNVGVSSDGELVRLIEEKRDQDIFLTILGFGSGNYKDSKMEKIADKGNGTYHYIDNIQEAEKVMVRELGSMLFTIAKDVKIQIEFNPSQVKAYRLIGYENRVLAKEDFNDDTKDAGELGAGHTVTALYEIVPWNSREEVTPGVDPLKYQQPTIRPSGDLMTVKLRYKEPKGFTSQLITKAVKPIDGPRVYLRIPSMSENLRFASAVAEFGLLLRNSQYKGRASYDHVLEQANQARSRDIGNYRADFIGLVERAKSLSPVYYYE